MKKLFAAVLSVAVALSLSPAVGTAQSNCPAEVTQAKDKARYRLVYQDNQVRVFENAQPMAQAFLVGNAVPVPPKREALNLMRDGTVDLRRSVELLGHAERELA